MKVSAKMYDFLDSLSELMEEHNVDAEVARDCLIFADLSSIAEFGDYLSAGTIKEYLKNVKV